MGGFTEQQQQARPVLAAAAAAAAVAADAAGARGSSSRLGWRGTESASKQPHVSLLARHWWQEAGIASKARRPAALSSPSSRGSRLASLSALRRTAAAAAAQSARTAAGLRVRGARKQQFVDGAGDEQVRSGGGGRAGAVWGDEKRHRSGPAVGRGGVDWCWSGTLRRERVYRRPAVGREWAHAGMAAWVGRIGAGAE